MTGARAYQSGAGDFDRDGKLDLFISDDSQGHCSQCWPHILLNRTKVPDTPFFINHTSPKRVQDDGFWDGQVHFGNLAVGLGDLDGDLDVDFYLAMGEANARNERNPPPDLFGDLVVRGDDRERDQIFLNECRR